MSLKHGKGVTARTISGRNQNREDQEQSHDQKPKARDQKPIKPGEEANIWRIFPTRQLIKTIEMSSTAR